MCCMLRGKKKMNSDDKRLKSEIIKLKKTLQQSKL